MKSKQLYSPIIKGKLNDLKAIERLPEDTRSKIKPLIEILPLPKKENSDIEKHLNKFVNYVEKYAQGGDMFIDLYGLKPKMRTPGGLDATLSGFRLLKERGISLTPTYGFERDEELWDLLGDVVENFDNGFCFRIDIDDLDDLADSTMGQVIDRSSQLGLKPKDVDLLIDLRDLADHDLDELKERVIDFLMLIPKGMKYRSIILAGSSALKTVTNIPKDGFAHILRKELHLWINLQRDIPESLSLIYGDYGVIHPDFIEMTGPNKNMNAKVRYTHQGRITYFRGHRLLRPVTDYEQYRELADNVRNSSGFMGGDFSNGDQYVENVANHIESTGSPATWVLADMNHHIVYTTMQMESLVGKVRVEEAELELEALFLE